MAIDVERLKLVNGFVFPKEDTECSAVMFEEVKKLMQLPYREFNVAVQAGGNVGVFPVALAQLFDEVITFEPDALNYECLTANLDRFIEQDQYVTAIRAGLADEIGTGYMTEEFTHENCGALNMAKGEGDIDLVPLDMYDLEHVDLIYLDVEGFEDLALKGAKETIARCKPVIVCENKGLNERFPAGLEGSQEFRDWLCAEFGYEFHSRLMRDDVFVCSK